MAAEAQRRRAGLKVRNTSRKRIKRATRGSRRLARQGAGGAAGAGGSNYQARVAAWVAAHLLAENPLPLGHLEAVPVVLLCQADQPVDDIVVETRASGSLLFQAKRDLTFSLSAGAEFWKVLDEFVRQAAACRKGAAGALPAGRALDGARDALILVTSRKPASSKFTALGKALNRLRSLPPSRGLAAAATSAAQVEALRDVSKALRVLWRQHFARAASGADLRGLLSLIHILQLDVGRLDPAETDAINALEGRVFLRRRDAKAGWRVLVQVAADLFEQRGGVDARLLEQRLSGFALRSAPSFEEDVEKIRAHTRENLTLLAPFRELDFAGEKVQIDRASTQALRASAEEGSLVLVGEPGAGKSGTIVALAQGLIEDGLDVVVLIADRSSAGSLAGLGRELALDHGIPEVLANWRGTSSAFLLIDGLDAARGEPAAKALRELIQLVSSRAPRWRVVPSIRRFDLRYSSDLQDLFRTTAPAGAAPYFDSDFSGICHFNVPLFDDSELADVGKRVPLFKALLGVAPAPFRDLVRNPFNLRLIASLLSAGASVEELSPMRAQVELLDRFWARRVLEGEGGADAREGVLRTICEEMVKARRLRIGRDLVSRDPSLSEPLRGLLSRQVLTESVDRATLGFGHHILFDYSAARLLLRGEGRLTGLLQDDAALTLVIRPSLVLHFQGLWQRELDRQVFWDEVVRLAQARVPETARTIGPTVAISEARAFADFAGIVSLLESSELAEHELAGQVFVHIVGALITRASPSAESFWVNILNALARRPSAATAYATKALLSFLTDRESGLPAAERALLGGVARSVLASLWDVGAAEPYSVVIAVQSVCRIADTDVGASVKLLRRGIEPDHIRAVGDRELSWLADELPRFFKLDPVFARDVYIGAFKNPITSTEPRPMGTGRIMPLVSNRGQDYRMALYRLVKDLPQFLLEAPLEATQAVLSIVEAHVRLERPADFEAIGEEVFDFAGGSARIKTDYSSIWDAGGVVAGEGHAALLSFASHVQKLAERGEIDTVRGLVEVVVSENRLAAVWRRLLLLGATHPASIGRLVRPLLWALPVLTSYDCSAVAGDLIKVVFISLDETDRGRIEAAILSIPEHLAGKDAEAVTHLRNRLLGCLPPESIVSPSASALRRQLAGSGGLPENRPPVVFGPMTSMAYSEEDELAGMGVPVDEPANAHIRELSKPAEEFGSTYLNAEPDEAACEGVLPALQGLHEALLAADGDLVHAEQSSLAWGHLVAAASQIAKSSSIESNVTLRSFVTDIGLAGSIHPRPELRPGQEESFDRFPTWGNAAPRVDAASTLVRLAWHHAALSQPILDALQRLVRDPVPAVRFHVAVHVHGLEQTAPDAMWQLIETIVRHETSAAILKWLVTGPLTRLARREPDRVQDLIQQIWERLGERAGAAEVQSGIIELWASLYVWRDDNPSLKALHRVAGNFPRAAEGVGHLPFVLRDVLTRGDTERADLGADTVRRRAFEVFMLFLDRARQVFEAARVSGSTDQDGLKASALLLDHMAAEVYFASGAFDEKRQNGGEKRTEAQRRRFFIEAMPAIEALAGVSIPSLTHRLLETIESFISFEPERVFLLVCRILESGSASGYQYEGLAADLFVRIVERYLASYPALFQESEACRRGLLEALDTFVRVGWPAARRLTYRLDDILR